MEKKKYALKTEESVLKSADGTENSEHIFDMIERAEMCYSNIQDNTDLCMNVFNLAKDKSEDDDELDALQLLCEDCIAFEGQAKEIIDNLNIIKGKIDKHIKVRESEVEEFLKEILILELHSKEKMEKVLKSN